MPRLLASGLTRDEFHQFKSFRTAGTKPPPPAPPATTAPPEVLAALSTKPANPCGFFESEDEEEEGGDDDGKGGIHEEGICADGVSSALLHSFALGPVEEHKGGDDELGQTWVKSHTGTGEMKEMNVPWNCRALNTEGVPLAECQAVLEFANALDVCQGQNEPLCDPLTLLRFLRARDGSVKDAEVMYRGSVAWRSSFGLARLMGEYGEGAGYALEGGGLTGPWAWQRNPQTKRAKLAERLSFYSRLDKGDTLEDDAPVMIWRIGLGDFSGIAREKLVDIVSEAFVTHLEELLQYGRKASFERKRLIRGRLIIDGTGLGIDILRHLSIIKRITSLGKEYFPETTASATIIHAPWIFAKVFDIVSPFLTPLQRSKVAVLRRSGPDDQQFGFRFTAHSGLQLTALPSCLGGTTSDAQCPEPEKAPVDAAKELGV
mmetsp:Transcript_58898/g.133327  ORF Transcript_58898/g.133327 Transcript_58898/m.133327 type:complete len:432 (+) Transcript_58898:60-1355(+)|eukprot:CAMPEP_0172611874 /NCGR_PEP_ID=MMETSP1068-20121228/31507_1 /TAXON_ID=35684 /ORGANISM="Pseudopedinella elastica, Strain CCMP716" /LENGTH=431 /DNA_ID=CAMNT_0013415959 /DNA_START=52 /DNA_END=1347 /DNA_ORIENTATION=+